MFTIVHLIFSLFIIYSDHPFNVLASTKEKRGVNDVNEGYFFCRLKKSTPNGKRIIRTIEGHGTWSEKSKTNQVRHGDRVVGIEKYLKYKPVKGSNEEEDEWKMHEYYRIGMDNETEQTVLCHISKKPRRPKRGQITTYAAAIIPIDYEASSSKRDRNEYEHEPSGSNNSVINNQDAYCLVLQSKRGRIECIDEGEAGYCLVPQGYNDSAVDDNKTDESFVEDIEGMLDVDDNDNNNVDNQAVTFKQVQSDQMYEVDGILQLAELGHHQVYDMEPLFLEQPEHGLSLSNGAEEGDDQTFHIEDIDQFIKDAEEAYWLPNGDSLTAGCDSTNVIGIHELDVPFPNITDADITWLLEQPVPS